MPLEFLLLRYRGAVDAADSIPFVKHAWDSASARISRTSVSPRLAMGTDAWARTSRCPAIQVEWTSHIGT